MEIRKIKKYFIDGKILIPPEPYGYEFFPVYYKNNPYVVQVKICLNETRMVKNAYDIKIIRAIYEYGADKKFLCGHRRQLIYKTHNPYVKIDDDRTLDIRKVSEKELKTYLPEILKSFFTEYEAHLLEEEKEEKQQEWLEQWNGVIDEPDKPKKALVFGDSEHTGTNPHEFFNHVQKTTINMNDVELVEKYNGIAKCYFMDPFFTHYLKKYLSLLDGNEWDPYEISDKEYIKTVLDKNKENPEAQVTLRIKTPIDTIAEAIERVRKAAPLYRELEADGVNPYNKNI